MICEAKDALQALNELRTIKVLDDEELAQYERFNALSEDEKITYILCTQYKRGDVAKKLGVSRTLLYYEMLRIQAKIDGKENYTYCGKEIKL